MSRRDRVNRLEQADTLARDRASLWRVFYRRSTSKGVRWLVKAPDEASAIKRVRGGYLALPILPSSEWREIYKEVGLSAG